MPIHLRTDVEVRRVGKREAEMVAAVIRKGFEEYKTRRRAPRGASITGGRVRKHIQSRKKTYGLAQINGRAAGAIGYRIRGRRLVFGPVCVLPDCRLGGVGSALMRWMEESARSRGCRVA